MTGKHGFLERTYTELDYQSGDLVAVADTDMLDGQDYIDKAQWLDLCRTISKNKSYKAESVFFVENNPVIVFVHASQSDRDKLHEIFNRVWCMASPRILFISTPTELNVYDLAHVPVRNPDELNALETVKKVSDIAARLKKFRRESIESGEVFGDHRFRSIDSRADRALVEDIKQVRQKLFDNGLNDDDPKDKKLKYAHALIGRSIFIRYLEDRGILTRDYFYNVAMKNSSWTSILKRQPAKPLLDPVAHQSLFLKVLSDIDFTYRLFDRLSEDFNGDMFPTGENERKAVESHHLTLLQQFLTGETGDQGSLFFWAYQFDIIPIELISNIYEELYHFEGKAIPKARRTNEDTNSSGTHYTPSALVEFVLSRVLTRERLEHSPRIIDPACGSGIFLVESFRRIVRYELHKSKSRHLSFQYLEGILKDQIAGIELNPEAVRITAFSLYLAFLHYQEPPDILEQIGKGNKLPNLIYTEKKEEGKKYFDILLHANAFAIEDAVSDSGIKKRFLSNCADIVVGNPPWGKVKPDNEAGNIAINWCKRFEKKTSDKEISQTFVWRTIDLLKEGGVAALLVSSGVLLRNSPSSNAVKRDLLQHICLQEIVNFIHVRHVFFSSAISPFISIVFKKSGSNSRDYIHYWTARKTKALTGTKAVVLDKTDFKFFENYETVRDDIWKIFYFGNHKDLALINMLRLFKPFKDFESKRIERRQGYKKSEKDRKDSGWLKEYKALPCESIDRRYGPIDISNRLIQVSDKVKERGSKEIFDGLRILMKRGPTENDYGVDGHIIARLETEKFAFTHAITCLKLESEEEDDYKVLLGILWSSLIRYYFFMTSSSWPIWHYQIYVNEILNMPVAIPENNELKDKIIKKVDELRNFVFEGLVDKHKIKKLESELDDAVFELYFCGEKERDLVRDRCKYDIDLFDETIDSPINHGGLRYGTFDILSRERCDQKGLDGYIYTFLKSFNPEVEEGKELNWEVIHHPTVSMVAVVFTLQTIGDIQKPVYSSESMRDWRKLLQEIQEATEIPYNQKIYIDGIVRVVTDNQVFIIKRNYARLWTRSAAHEDVEAIYLQALIREKQIG